MEEDDLTHYDLTGGTKADNQKVVILVKLTDSALKALLHCARRTNRTGKLRIRFGDINNPLAENELIIPSDNVPASNATEQRRSDGSKSKSGLGRSLSDDSDDEQVPGRSLAKRNTEVSASNSDCDRFTFAVDRETGGCVECVERRRKIWRLIGTIEWRAQIHANADVYDTTRERIDECEREARKQRTRTLDPHSTNSKSTRIVIKKQPIVAALQKRSIAALPDRVTPQLRPPVNPIVPPVSNAITQGPNNTSTKLSARSGQSQTQNGQTAVANGAKTQLAKQTVSVRERVLHVLALNSFTKSELILKLQSVGGAMSKLSPLRDDEKLQIGDALNELAEPRPRRRGASSNPADNDCAYVLKRNFYAEVNADWPFYDANERAIVRERKRSAAANVEVEQVSKSSSSTIVQPVPNGYSAKRNDSDGEVTHQRERQSEAGNKRPRMEPEVSAPRASALEEDFQTQFVTIIADEQRARYKEAFEVGYSELQRVLATILPVSEMFRAFDNELQSVKPHTPRYKELHAKIVATYQKYTGDEEYMRTRQRAQYLHKKLRHIKALITDYDAKRASCPT